MEKFEIWSARMITDLLWTLTTSGGKMRKEQSRKYHWPFNFILDGEHVPTSPRPPPPPKSGFLDKVQVWPMVHTSKSPKVKLQFQVISGMSRSPCKHFPFAWVKWVKEDLTGIFCIFSLLNTAFEELIAFQVSNYNSCFMALEYLLLQNVVCQCRHLFYLICLFKQYLFFTFVIMKLI